LVLKNPVGSIGFRHSQTIRRAVTAAVIAAGLMAQGSAVPAALAANGNLDHFDVAVSGPSTAGTALNLTVTAKDAMNRTIRAVSGTQCLVLGGLPASPAPVSKGADYPGPGTACVAPQSAVTFANGIGSPAVTAYRAGSNTLNVADATGLVTGSATFTVAAAAASSLAYTAAPIDTKINAPIYSACAPDPDNLDPCATTTETPASSPVKVQEFDAWSNFGTNTVTIKVGSSTLATATPNSSGVASFGELLKIGTIGTPVLHATAGTASADAQIQIVFELKACTGQSCKNSVDNGAKNIQRAVNTITTSTGDFFAGGANVRLATSFFNTAGECGVSTFVGQGTEAKVEGSLGSTQPSTTMLLIIPKRSLQAFGVASRNADSFNVCVGVTSLQTGTPAWTGKGPVTSSDGVVFWGTVADCSTFPSGTTNPCAAVKSKNVGDVVAYYNSIHDLATAASIPSLMSNSDLAIVIHKGFPWDGKAGIYS
jgi:hypothetical protein